MFKSKQEHKACLGCSLRVVLSLIALLAIIPYASGQKSAKVNFAKHESTDGEMALLDLLEMLQQQEGYVFIFDEQIVKEQTLSLAGEAKQRFAKFLLEEISRQTNLQFKPIKDKTFLIKRIKREKVWLSGYCKDRFGKPLEGANISIIGQQCGVISDEEGYFRIEVDRGDHELVASFVGYETLRSPLEIDGFADKQLSLHFDQFLQLQEVLVVGHRFAPSSIQELSAPVDIVEEEQIEQSLESDLSQLLQYEAPSFHSTHQTVSDGTDHVDPISLKGLGPDQVLVLVNGKRRHASALVNVNGTVGRGSVGIDLNAIPLDAVRKVEILKDGAAALYGSDAIAGVINLQLKEGVNQGFVKLQQGMTERGDGQVLSLGAHYGFKAGKDGHVNLTFYAKNRGAVNRSGAYQGPIFGDERDEDAASRERFFDQLDLGGNRVMQAGSSAIFNSGVMVNTSLPIHDQLEFYTHGNFNLRDGRATGFYRFPYQTSKQSGLYPLGFLPEIHTSIHDVSMVNGVRGEVNGWAFDFSNNWGQNTFDFQVENSNNASLGLQSPTSAYAGGFSYLHNLLGLDVTKKSLWNQPIHVAFGTEFRFERYWQREGMEVSWQDYGFQQTGAAPKEGGFQVFPGFRPENANRKFRNNIGFYGDLEFELSSRMSLGLAGRLEDYTDFGSNFNWKLAYRYRLGTNLSLRSSYNTGFRAPSLQQIGFSSYSLQFLPVGGELLATSVAHPHHDNAIIKRLAIPALQPERSRNFNVGLAGSTRRYWMFSVDAYQINIADRIVLTGQIEPMAQDRIQEVLASSGVDRVQFFTNAINTRTLGLDAKIRYRRQWKSSQIELMAGFNMNKTQVRAQELPSPYLEEYQSILFNREEVARLERGQPSSKLILVTSLKKKRWGTSVRFTRFGSVSYLHPMDDNPANWIRNQYTNQLETRDQLFAAKWLCDVDVSWKLNSLFQLSLGISNALDVYPDRHHHYANTHHGVLTYSRRVQQFGVGGRRWLVKAHYNINHSSNISKKQ
ncbi:MAG: TonB-dependent receptor [Saprospiraceae bacterium]|nr:TonB-dependent receptor [Saprospiraceae bacterium]